jgi:hypothetical protein
MSFRVKMCFASVAVVLLASFALAQVSPEEAAQLKTTLTPMGAEKAGNKEGTIPPWTGGYTTPLTGYKNGGRRPDPFASDKPLFSITAQNMDQYADKLTDGQKALLKKYPTTYRMDVYQSKRTHANPQWLYDNTFKNATRVKPTASNIGMYPQNAVGGVPFPIPHNGVEVMWNDVTRFVGTTSGVLVRHYLVTPDGKPVLLGHTFGLEEFPYYFKDMTPEKMGKVFLLARTYQEGPPIRAGEALLGQFGWDDESTQIWTYLTGQRRTRKLPNPCCDTPTPTAAGAIGLDEVSVYYGNHFERFDWKLKGKKEIYVPYNCNLTMVPTKDSEVMMPHHLNPKYVRWELHRVWVVEATLKPGFRHQAPRSIYYIDEDSWAALLSDRWDASGHLWKVNYALAMAAPDILSTLSWVSGTYDLVSGSWVPMFMMNEEPRQIWMLPRQPEEAWTPGALAALGIR